MFNEACPFYISIGMSYDDYWHKDVLMVKYYRDAHLMKLQQSEQQLWLQGVYIYEALIKVAPILHAFAKNGTKPEPYSDKPYGMFKKPDPKEKEMEKELEIKKAQIFFQNWASANKNIK